MEQWWRTSGNGVVGVSISTAAVSTRIGRNQIVLTAGSVAATPTSLTRRRSLLLQAMGLCVIHWDEFQPTWCSLMPMGRWSAESFSKAHASHALCALGRVLGVPQLDRG